MTTVITKYIDEQSIEVKEDLMRIHEMILSEVPDASQVIKYGIPTYVYHKNFVHFAAYTYHIGFYQTPEVIAAFKSQLKPYKCSKGAIQFSLGQIPFELIREMIIYRKRQIDHIQKKRIL